MTIFTKEGKLLIYCTLIKNSHPISKPGKEKIRNIE